MTITTYVSYPARPVHAKDGLRVEFTIPVHSEMLSMVPNGKATITCKCRVWKGFKWGQLGSGAELKLVGQLVAGPRGGMYLMCSAVEILKGVPISGPKLPKSIISKLEKEYATS